MSAANLYQWKLVSDIGEVHLVASERGLTRAHWSRQMGVPYLKTLSVGAPQAKILKQAVIEITEYLAGKRRRFHVPLDLQGTAFQILVWSELLKINYGQTKSYKDVAVAIGTGAIRAVGSANGKNPLCVFIPCHRVIASNGTLGGYSGGLEIKKILIALENRWG